MVWQAKTSVGVKTWSSCKPTSKVWLEMCFWLVSSFLTLVPSQPNLDTNSGRIIGYPTLSASRSLWLRALSHLRSSLPKLSKLSGKTKDSPQITWVSKTLQSYLPALDGLFWSTLNFKVPIGSEDPKEITFLPSTSTKSIGWDNLPKTSHRVELSCLRESKKKSKLHLIHFLLELSSRKQVAIHSNSVLRSSIMTLNSSFI